MWAGPRAGRSSSVACLTLFGPSHVLEGCGWECVGWVVSPRVGFGFAFGFEFVCMNVWGCSNSPSTLLLLLPLLLCTRKIDCGESWKVARYARGLTCSWSVSVSECYIYLCMYVCMYLGYRVYCCLLAPVWRVDWLVSMAAAATWYVIRCDSQMVAMGTRSR